MKTSNGVNLKSIDYKRIKNKIKNNMENASERIQKLTEALYRVTELFPDKEPLKWQLRANAIELLDFLATAEGKEISDSRKSADLAKKISCFLKLAYDSSAFIYSINFEILRQEYLNLGDSLKLHIEDKKIIFNLNPGSNGHSSDSNGHLPDYNGHKKQKDNVEQSQQIEQIEQTGQPQQPIVLKERKRKILSLLDKNEWRNIRDICHSLPGLATKSVQRDLLEMVGAGILKKEGNKRWRKYSVVG